VAHSLVAVLLTLSNMDSDDDTCRHHLCHMSSEAVR
jgi:hypothetical protein